MSYRNDLDRIRKDYPNNCIWYGFNYSNKNIFLLSGHDTFIDNDTESCLIYVENDKIKVFDDDEAVMYDYKNYSDSISKKVFIDITENDLKRARFKASSL